MAIWKSRFYPWRRSTPARHGRMASWWRRFCSSRRSIEAVLERNTRLEGQVAALSTSFLSLKEGMQFLNDWERQLRIMGPEPRLLLRAKEYCEADRQESNGGEGTDAAAAGAGDQLADVDGDGRKRSSRKCSEWPDEAQPLSPRTPRAARVAYVDEDECAMDGSFELPPTPPSASSTNAPSSAKLLLLSAPNSPVQPPPQPPATSSSPRDADLQEPAQPHSIGLDLQLRHTAHDAAHQHAPAALAPSHGTRVRRAAAGERAHGPGRAGPVARGDDGAGHLGALGLRGGAALEQHHLVAVGGACCCTRVSGTCGTGRSGWRR